MYPKYAKLIYSRGSDKVNLLQQLMVREFINLDDDERFPSFDKLPTSHAYCIVQYEKCHV